MGSRASGRGMEGPMRMVQTREVHDPGPVQVVQGGAKAVHSCEYTIRIYSCIII